MPKHGEIWLDSRYYLDRETGEEKSKYLLVLALDGGDVVYRLLTSRQYGRPRTPACYHGDPYPGFYLGVLGGKLQLESWLDLHGQDNIEAGYFNKNKLTFVASLPDPILCQALLCAANAEDTTGRQKRAIYATRQALRC